MFRYILLWENKRQGLGENWSTVYRLLQKSPTHPTSQSWNSSYKLQPFFEIMRCRLTGGRGGSSFFPRCGMHRLDGRSRTFNNDGAAAADEEGEGDLPPSIPTPAAHAKCRQCRLTGASCP